MRIGSRIVESIKTNKMKEEKKYTLPKDFAEEWLTALRSGKYKQAKTVLYNKNTKGYCCLGVACAIKYSLNYLKAEESRYAGVIEKSEYNLRFDLKKIPEQLKGGDQIKNDLVITLTDMNDSGKTFDEIADWIEKNIEFI
jgi:hypothetical protein